MLSYAGPELFKQTLADKQAITMVAKRDRSAGSPFFYCVGSQCFTPSGSR